MTPRTPPSDAPISVEQLAREVERNEQDGAISISQPHVCPVCGCPIVPVE